MIIGRNTVTNEYKKLYDFNQKKIGIPIFQRFYAWKKQQIAQLLDDILLAIKNPNKQLYFLDFIYYSDEQKIMMADGQQRLVTINNLIKAIKDYSSQHNIEIDDIDLFDITYDINANQKKYETHFNNYPVKPFKTVYLAMLDFVKDNENNINEIIKVIKEQIYVFFKKCADADDAFLIFQQINTGGKPLSKDDVIKTAIDQFAKVYHVPFDYKKIKDVKQALTSYYKLKKDDTTKNFDSIEIMAFLKDYVTKDKETFKNFVDTTKLLQHLENNPIRHVINYINRATLLDVLNILAIKKIDIMQKRDYLTKLMVPLCNLSIILTLNGGSPTTFRYLLNDVIAMIKNGKKPDEIRSLLIKTANENPTTWKISFEDFAKALGNPEVSRGIKKALLILDVIVDNTSGTVDVPKINLEHIYPQKPDSDWAVHGWPTSNDEMKKLIENIGNYLLLNEQVNKKIQNKYITDKVEKYNQIIHKDRLLQTEANTVDFEKFEKNRAAYIATRQREIAKHLSRNIPLGEVLIVHE